MTTAPWPMVRLDSIAEVRLGRQRSPKNHSGDQMRPYVRAANVGWGGLKLDDVLEMNFTDREMETYRLVDGDLLLGEASGSPAEVGKPAIWRGEIENCAFQNTLIRVRPDGADSEYLLHYFRYMAASGQFAAAAKGVGINHLGAETLASWMTPVPPAAEQRRIVSVLDEADALRSKRRESLARIDELAQSVFLSMFGDPKENPRGWQRHTLLELFDAAGAQNGLYKPASYYGSGVPIVRIDAFYGGVISGIDRLKRVEVSAEETMRYGLRMDDILINRVNSREYLGKSAIVPTLSEPTIFESNMMRIRLDSDKADARYVVEFLQSAYIRSQILTAAKDAVNQSSINQTDVASFIVNVPQLNLQKEFRRRLEALDEHRARCDLQAAQFDHLFASVQSRAFRGEL